MRFFYTIPEAVNYALEVLNATTKDAETIREQLEARSVAKFNGLVLFYDELHLLD
jgi:replication-associated recombination protein RarA